MAPTQSCEHRTGCRMEGGVGMGTTYLHAVASLDGYIADERDDVGPLHDWYFNGDHPLVDEDHADVHGAPFRVSAASADYVRGMWSRQKVLVIGRHQFDLTNGWEATRRRATTSSSCRTDRGRRAGTRRRRTTSPPRWRRESREHRSRLARGRLVWARVRSAGKRCRWGSSTTWRSTSCRSSSAGGSRTSGRSLTAT